jgi:hypothetical protein
MTIGTFLEMQKDRHFVQAKFERFQEAWRHVRSTVTRYECKDLPADVALSVDLRSPLRWCCIDIKDESLIVLALIMELSRRQNALLEEFLLLASDPKSAFSAARLATLELRGVAGLPSVNVQSAQMKEIIGAQEDGKSGIDALASNLMQFAHHELYYSKGNILRLDWARMEREVVQDVFFGKVILDVEASKLKLFMFSGELFQSGSAYMIDTIRDLVSQEPLPVQVLDSIRSAADFGNYWQKHMDAISTVIFILSNQLGRNNTTQVNPTLQLLSLPSLVTPTTYQNAVDVLKPTPLGLPGVQLRHAVSAFEAIEDRGFDVIYHTVVNKLNDQVCLCEGTFMYLAILEGCV